MPSRGQAVVELVKSREGKNTYTQGVNRTKVDSGYSDCSALMQWAYRNGAGIEIGSNTVSQIQSNQLETVTLSIVNGVPDENQMQVGDLLYFRGTDTSRKSSQYVGHVEVYVGNGQLSGHGSGIGPTRKNLSTYCKTRRQTSSPVPGGNRGLICVRRMKGVDEVFFATCSGGSVNIRKGRGANYAILGVLNKGDKMLALTAVNGWCEIAAEVNGSLIIGYMSAQYVQTMT